MRSTIDRLHDCGWQGAIIGPHGTGKTTLLHALMPELITAGRNSSSLALHDGQHRMSLSRTEWSRARSGEVVLIIDGYEQLGCRSRTRVWFKQKLKGFGLLVTAHADLRLPTIFRTHGDLAHLNDLVDQWLPSHGGRILPADIEGAFARRAGNIRRGDVRSLRFVRGPANEQ